MKLLEDIFVLLHIKISHIRLLVIPGRVLMSLVFVMLLIFGSMQLYISTKTPPDVSGFIESMLYSLFIAYSFWFWIKSWSKADKMLRKASSYEERSKSHK